MQHWQPDTHAIPLRSGGEGGGMGAALAVVAGAVLLGLAVGAGPAWWSRTEPAVTAKPDRPIEWDAIQGAPPAAVSAEDRAWQGRADALDRPAAVAAAARTSAVRARFGFCHNGGGSHCVVDGDTFYVAGAKVRIAGIDAPETHPPRCAAEARLGRAATERLHALLNSGPVGLSGSGRDRDRYGRLLRDVSVDGADVGEAMIGAGLARPYGSGRRSWC